MYDGYYNSIMVCHDNLLRTFRQPYGINEPLSVAAVCDRPYTDAAVSFQLLVY